MEDFLFYLQLGWEHIVSWDALDHQLFVLAVVCAFGYKDFKKLLVLITAFTIGHSITLFLSVLDVVRISSFWVEFLIPVTIFITAAENLFFLNKNKNFFTTHYLLALFFGLIHGMGFANTARMMMAQEQELFVPLLGFNVGLELGQILVILVVFAGLYFYEKKLNFPKKYWTFGWSLLCVIFSAKMIWERAILN